MTDKLNDTGLTALIIHDAGQIGFYDRKAIARILNSTDEEKPMLTRRTVHPEAAAYTSLDESPLFGSNPPSVVFIQDKELIQKLDQPDLDAVRKAEKAGIPVGMYGEGSELREFLGRSTKTRSLQEENPHALYCTARTKRGKVRDLLLKNANTSDGHFPFTSDVEDAVLGIPSDLLGGLLTMPTVRVSVETTEAPGGPWNSLGETQVMTYTGDGGTGRLWITPFKLNSEPVRSKGRLVDYYLFDLQFSQGNVNYVQGAGQVGYYCNEMKLKITLPNAGKLGSRLYEYGPNSTVRQATTGFSIGGGLTGKIDASPGVQIPVTASFTTSFSSPEVRFVATPYYGDKKENVEIEALLPHVGWLNPGVPANPGDASKGYLWDPAFIMEVPADQNPTFEIFVLVRWRYDKPRGNKKEIDEWWDNREYTFRMPANKALS